MKNVKMSKYDKIIGSLRWLFLPGFIFVCLFFKVDEWMTLVSSL